MRLVNRKSYRPFSLTKVRDLDIPSGFPTQLFPVEREVMRKKYLLSLENRTAKELSEEEALYVELKRIEQNEKRFKQDRERLLRTLLGAESGLPDLPIDEDGPLGDPKKKRKGIASELDSPATPSSSLFASAVPRRAQSAKSAAHGTSQHRFLHTTL
jgi:DNA methyltransferase 1-associated protein 1